MQNFHLWERKKLGVSLVVADEDISVASLKVTSITTRVIKYDDLKNTYQIDFDYILEDNCKVTLELQQKIGSAYEKVTDKLNSVNGSQTHTLGAYTLDLSSTGGTITSSFASFKLSNSTERGTYRLVFKIYNENGEQILEVPYNLLVI